jgi:hypothetical protein
VNGGSIKINPALRAMSSFQDPSDPTQNVMREMNRPVLRAGCVGRAGKGNNIRAVLLDTQGPEIRTTKVVGDTGKTTVNLMKGSAVTIKSSKTEVRAIILL